MTNKVFLRFAQSPQNNPGQITVEVGFSSPLEFHREKESKCSFPPTTYKVEIEHVFHAPESETLLDIIKRIATRMKELSGYSHDATSMTWINGEWYSPASPEAIEYLPISAWPTKNETQEEANARCEKENATRIESIKNAFRELVKELN